MPSLEFVLGITFLVATYLICRYHWRRDARRAVLEWFADKSIVEDSSQTPRFTMGRPARMEILGVEAGTRYIFVFDLYSSIFNMPKSLLQVWGKVALREKTPC